MFTIVHWSCYSLGNLILNGHKMVFRFLLAFLLLCFGVVTAAEQNQSNSVVFLHFNDFYEVEGRFGKGGLLSLQQSITQQKLNYPDAIVTFGGDLLSPSVYSALPFANRVGVVKLNGKQLLTILEHGVSALKKYAGRFPQVSGFSFEYSPQSNPGW